jgi:diaminopimelate decarboxylase
MNGLHCHIGTFILDPRAYAAEVNVLCVLAKEIEEDGTRLSYLDIGGGLPSRNALQGIYLPPEQAVPDAEEYAEAICTAFLEGTAYRLECGDERPMLVFESGRAVIDDAQSLITSVVGRKELADGRPAAILDAGLNALFTALWYDHPVRLASPARGEPRDTVLYGPLCMNIDVVRRSVQLPPLAVGDRLVVNPVGAYNTTQSMQFIEYRPATVLIHGDTRQPEVSVIRAAENLDVVCGPERLPAHLVSLSVDSAQVIPLRVAGG